jgi:hypothetical protein
MDFLKSIAGMFASSVMRLAVAVGIIAAIYFFAIRPVLDTTNKALDTANGFQLQDGSAGGDLSRQIQRTINQTNRQIRRQLRQSGRQSNVAQRAPGQVQITRTFHGLTPRQARRLTRCVQRAQPQLARVNRCFDRFARK